jgi:hypothetical protein
VRRVATIATLQRYLFFEIREPMDIRTLTFVQARGGWSSEPTRG